MFSGIMEPVNDKPVECPESGCGRRFKEKNDLRQHCHKMGHNMTRPPTKTAAPTWASVAVSAKAGDTLPKTIHLKKMEPAWIAVVERLCEEQRRAAADELYRIYTERDARRNGPPAFYGPEPDPEAYLDKLRCKLHSTERLSFYNYAVGTQSHRYAPHYPASDFEEAPEPGDDPSSSFSLATTSSTQSKKKRAAVALDCEMVGAGTPGEPSTNHDALARLTVVDVLTKEVLIDDAYVGTAPHEVHEWRTEYSGIRPEEYFPALERGGPGAFPDWRAARRALFDHIDKDTILVGHAMHNDLKVLRVRHSRCVDSSILTRERRVQLGVRYPNYYKLKFLAMLLCDHNIQRGGQEGHCSREDALATIDVVHELLTSGDFIRYLWTQYRE